MNTLFSLAKKWESRFSMEGDHRGLYDDALHRSILDGLREWGMSVPRYELDRFGTPLRKLVSLTTTRAPTLIEITPRGHEPEVRVRYSTEEGFSHLSITPTILIFLDGTSRKEVAFPAKWETTFSV
jgi:hypothetical protein